MIIEAAVNGGTTKATNPNVPISDDEIVADALACFEAGAAIVHHHITGHGRSGAEAAEVYLGIWRRVLADRPDALWYPTINLGPDTGWYDHIAPLAASGLLRLSLSDPGPVNLGRLDDHGVPAGGWTYRNTFDQIAEQLALCRDHGLGPSFAIYEPGFARVVVAYHRAGRLPPGALLKFYLAADRGLTGTPFGLPVTPTALAAYLEIVDGTGLAWAVSAVGDDLGRSPVIGPALALGGHLHVGLEFYGGDRQPTNAELVTEAVAAADSAGRPVADGVTAARLLGLPTR
ncbi:MAG: 3-keto-5-aminohexanoate cleavage protein [Acidimicrobiales bacterium]